MQCVKADWFVASQNKLVKYVAMYM